jgi:hypothetical protein
MGKLLSEWFRMFKKDAASFEEKNIYKYKLKFRRQFIQNKRRRKNP